MKLLNAIVFFIAGYFIAQVDTSAFMGRTKFFVQPQANIQQERNVQQQSNILPQPKSKTLQLPTIQPQRLQSKNEPSHVGCETQPEPEKAGGSAPPPPPTHSDDSDPFANFVPRMYPLVKSTMTEDEAFDLLTRLPRSAGNEGGEGQPPKKCKYRKGTWSACDPTSKLRTRTDTLRKGDSSICDGLKTRKKECSPGRKGAKQRNNSKSRAKKLQLQE